MSHGQIWDDSALVDSWNEALEEYKLYHSLHAKGESVIPPYVPASTISESGRVEDMLAQDMTEETTLMPDGGKDGNRLGVGLQDNEQLEKTAALGQRDSHLSRVGATRTEPLSTSSGPPVPNHLIGTVQDEGLKNLLMSWYYAGYYTGLYEGQQQPKPGL